MKERQNLYFFIDKEIGMIYLPPIFANKKEKNRVSSIKFLGVIFDENLSSNEHLNRVENTLSKILEFFIKLKKL